MGDSAAPGAAASSVRVGELVAGDRVQITDRKGRRHTVWLESGGTFHTHHGQVAHDDIIVSPEGVVVESTGWMSYLALRPTLADITTAMPRGATVVYPKDAMVILGLADIGPGLTVVEAGAGSGALSLWLLRAVGTSGTVHSYERREDFASVAARNVERYFGARPEHWTLTVGDLAEHLGSDHGQGSVDRVVLDMLAPWECLPAVADAMRPGGSLCVYVATTTQMSRVVETARALQAFTEPAALESLQRTWHVEGLSVRPDHRMVGHTGFLVAMRRLAPGVVPPARRRRPAPGAYGSEWSPPPTDPSG